MSRKQRSSARRGTGSAGSPAGRTARPPERGRGQPRTWLLLGAAAVIGAVSVAAVVFAQGSGKTTGPAAFRSAAPTSRPSTAVFGSSGGATAAVPTVDPAATGFPTLDGVACDPTEGVTYHVHAHLNIRVAGQLETIPGDVGQRATCLYWLHTHQPLGVIHVEAPVRMDFSLGQFFDVWGKPLTPTQVGDWPVPAGSKIWVFVDRKQVDTDPRSVLLTDLEAVELQVGPAPLEPLPYTFPADFG